ncbi:ATP-grasp domain-containing protein [Actinacidiphila rubida]|uniref:Biotin carboxylase n=1 Tax=Actinacidiphila rubida TaxID=310780 RepID=A0A1H8R9G2_9ACTN|nr:ATP-grasp domain-containing protein [Actinacidiphila rubida]SEO62937.1 Biotin carboxylase [Actinacidiphila rubida]
MTAPAPTTTEAGNGGGLPLVVLVHSGYQLLREYLLEQVAACARVWLFQGTEPTWEKPYLAGHTVVDPYDVTAMTAAAHDLTARHRVQGVACWNELLVEQTAQLQAALGLPGADPQAVSRCRDKHLTRRFLAQAGVPQATSLPVASAAEAAAAARHLGYPVVVKPRALGASVGVRRVDSPAHIADAYTQAGALNLEGVPDFGGSVLVEEYLDGEEISVDAAVRDGRLTLLYVAHKTCAFPPYFEEVGHSVAADDPLLDDAALIDVLERAHRAVGYDTGITHTELRLTSAGPKVVEINARLGGDLIPLVADVVAGAGPGRLVVDVACGRPVRAPGRRPACAQVRFLYPEADCVVTEVRIDRDALPAGTVRAEPMAHPGQQLSLPPAGHVTSRYGYVLVTGPTAQHCRRTAQAAARAVRLVAARPDHAGPPGPDDPHPQQEQYVSGGQES